MKDPKVSRDPITGYPTIEILGRTIVLQKDVKNPEEALNKPAQETVECAL